MSPDLTLVSSSTSLTLRSVCVRQCNWETPSDCIIIGVFLRQRDSGVRKRYMKQRKGENLNTERNRLSYTVLTTTHKRFRTRISDDVKENDKTLKPRWSDTSSGQSGHTYSPVYFFWPLPGHLSVVVYGLWPSTGEVELVRKLVYVGTLTWVRFDPLLDVFVGFRSPRCSVTTEFRVAPHQTLGRFRLLYEDIVCRGFEHRVYYF